VRDEILRMLREANPGQEARVSAFFEIEVMPILLTRNFDYVEPMAEALAQRFTADEIDQMIAFYKTPTGQKLLREWPSLRMEMNVVSVTAQRKLRDDVLYVIAPQVRQYGFHLPLH
jgi:hypothetical protein